MIRKIRCYYNIFYGAGIGMFGFFRARLFSGQFPLQFGSAANKKRPPCILCKAVCDYHVNMGLFQFFIPKPYGMANFLAVNP